MARPGPATFAKRQRELSKKRKRQEKLERRAMRKEQKVEDAANASDIGGDMDPDIAGIIPGPQPPLDF